MSQGRTVTDNVSFEALEKRLLTTLGTRLELRAEASMQRDSVTLFGAA